MDHSVLCAASDRTSAPAPGLAPHPPRVNGAQCRYDAAFDKEDILHGKIEVSVGNTFLENKFSWSSGASSMADVKVANLKLKASTGGCPMLGADHSRTDDFTHPAFVAASTKRHNWFLRYVQEKLGGVLLETKDITSKSKK